jgi:hypothetical protein
MEYDYKPRPNEDNPLCWCVFIEGTSICIAIFGSKDEAIDFIKELTNRAAYEQDIKYLAKLIDEWLREIHFFKKLEIDKIKLAQKKTEELWRKFFLEHIPKPFGPS